MELDRQTIEKRDFPIGRRGYEPEAVDAHLATVADEFDNLRRSAPGRSGESLAVAASAQVQAIVEAAESTAADIERQADAGAQRIRQEAERAAERTRDDAVERARSHVEAVSKAASLMLQRVDAMESELNALVESLRTGANRLTADLVLLEGNMGELYDAAGRDVGHGAATAPPAPPAPGASLAAGPEQEFEEAFGSAEGEADAEAAAAESAADAPPAAQPPASSGGGDLDGARLIALNMALNGQPREEADTYLAENFDLADRQALLDEVYAAVEG